MANYIKDNEGMIKVIAGKVIKESFPKMANINIYYIFRDKSWNSKGKEIDKDIKKVSGIYKEITGIDLILIVAESAWSSAKEPRIREAMIHEEFCKVELQDKEGTEGFPRRLADNWYMLSDGKKIKGLKEAEEAQANICDYEVKVYDYDITANSKNFKKYGAWKQELAVMKQTVLQPDLPTMRVVND